MARVKRSSVMEKVKAYSRSVRGKLAMQEKIAEYRRNGVTKTEAGGHIVGAEDMEVAASKLIHVLNMAAAEAGLPASVLEHFEHLAYTAPRQVSDDEWEMQIYFADDLHRDSLQPDQYGGVDNIVALLNNGYGSHPKMEEVWGEWHGVWTHGLSERFGLHFIDQAIADFNGNYGAEYNVTATAGDAYH